MNISDMASFENNNRWTSSPSDIPKFSIKRLEPSIQKFLKVVEIDLDRLHKHRLNIEKFSRLQDWNSLNKEQINTTRTVQQIVTNIKEIEKTRRQTQDSDLQTFDERIKDMKSAAFTAIKEFVEVQRNDNVTCTEIPDSSEDASLSHPLLPDKHTDDLTQTSLPVSGMEQLKITPIPEDTEAMESWENLHQSLMELNTMIQHFSTEVHTQQEKVDNIEDNIETAHDNVNEGTRQLGMASKYKAAILPIAGALIGTVVAGPVGFFAGAKIGGAVGLVGGGVAGFAGGKIVKSRQNDITNIEMTNLSEKKSNDDSKSETNGNSWLPWNW